MVAHQAFQVHIQHIQRPEVRVDPYGKYVKLCACMHSGVQKSETTSQDTSF